MKLSFHANFDGRCAEAFEFYQKHLGAIAGPLLTYQDSPASAAVPEAWQDKVVHGSISFDSFELAGTDLLPEDYKAPQGFCLLIRIPCKDTVKSLFDVFKKGGEVVMAPQETFWSPCYAIVTDRFGIPWKFNCVPEQ